MLSAQQERARCCGFSKGLTLVLVVRWLTWLTLRARNLSFID
jgi:hypothetical protein